MKKSLLTAGLASVAVAAMPMAGVFAATGTTVTDTVQVTINSACSITTTGTGAPDFTYSKTMTNGSLLNTEDASGFGSTEMSISCNNAGGWHVTAVGSGEYTGDVTKMKPTASGTAIDTGTATSGDTSNWAFKVTGAVGQTQTDYHTDYAAVPSSAADVAKSTSSSAGSVINTHYQVYISPTQQADTYTGQVTYTLAQPAA